MRIHSLRQKRRGNGGDAYETPSLVWVLNEFSDDERRKDARCFYPMARTIRSMRIVKSLPG